MHPPVEDFGLTGYQFDSYSQSSLKIPDNASFWIYSSTENGFLIEQKILLCITNTRTNASEFTEQAIYDPSSNQFRDPPTYTHQPSMQQKVPFSLIRCSSSKVAFCNCVEWGWHIYNIVESESDPLTRRAVDLFEKEPLKGNSEVHLHTPTKFGEDRSKDLGGDREQTDRQTNRQTDKRCSIYSMILLCSGWAHGNKRHIIIFPCQIFWGNHIKYLVCDFRLLDKQWGFFPITKYNAACFIYLLPVLSNGLQMRIWDHTRFKVPIKG